MKRLLIICTAFLFCGMLAAQSTTPTVLASAGGESTQLSWTAGETVVQTLTSSSVVLTQGFHQPNLVITSIAEPSLPTPATITVFPNPVNDQLNIRIEESRELLTVTVFDLQGKLLLPATAPIGNGTHSYDFSTFSAGTYYLRAVDATGKQVKTVKILKRN